ncbi:Pre-mRNA-splicing factor of RES complex-domain-containing protein [Coemansia spiralis]|nr:Pre-mRNA-splicing factor of RES complex-domain-containing protein [Coemansia spiralis]
MGLDDYLAKHYGSASEKKRKVKKSKYTDKASAYGSSIIIDDSDDRVLKSQHRESNNEDRKEESKAKDRFKDAESSWHTVRPAKISEVDILLDSAVDDEERPAIAKGEDLLKEFHDKKEREAMEREEERKRRKALKRQMELEQRETNKSKKQLPDADRPELPFEMRYGLQTAKEYKEDADREREQYMRRLREVTDGKEGKTEETVYRDAKTGRRIDVDEARKETDDRRKQQEQARFMQTEWNKGLVQQKEKLEEQRLLESMRGSGIGAIGTSAYDEELRAKQHWDDPALRFLENTKTEKRVYPEFQGYAPPNRFGIRPGYRWDGVDRSNGFERELFKRQASASARQTEAYSNSVADW